MEDEHNEQDNKVLVHSQCQANQNGMEDDAKFQDCHTDYLSRDGIRAEIGGRGGLFVSFLVMNVVVTIRSVALCGGWLSEYWVR